MAGEMDFRLLNTNAPAEAALAPIKGMGAVNALQSQQLQNQAAQMEIQNALAEQEAYKQAGGDVSAAQKNLMGSGLGKQSVALGKAVAETEQAKIKTMAERLPIQRDMAKDMAFNPSDQNVIAHLQDQIIKGWITPEQAQQRWTNVAGMSPEQRKQFFLQGATKAEDVLQQMETQRHNLRTEGISQQNANIAGGHLALARDKVEAEPATQALISKAILEKRLDPNRVNSRNIKMIGATLAMDPNADLRQLSEDAASGMASNRTIGTQQANVAMAATEARDMIGIAKDLSGKVDRTRYPSINSIQNAIDKGTGDENLVAFNAAINAAVNTYARAINPKGVATVDSMKHARELINSKYSAGQFGAITDVMDKELKAAQQSGEKARGVLRGTKSELIGEDKAAADWAKANPNDPRAAKINQRLGL